MKYLLAQGELQGVLEQSWSKLKLGCLQDFCYLLQKFPELFRIFSYEMNFYFFKLWQINLC